MLVSASILLLIAVIHLFFLNKNRFKYVFFLYYISISLLMTISTVYIYKLTNYNFSSRYDFLLYQAVNRLKLSLSDVSRLQNLCVALFMLSAVIFVGIFKRLRFIFLVLSVIPVLLFLFVNDPAYTLALFIRAASGHQILVSRVVAVSRGFSLGLFFIYSTLPLFFLADGFIKSKIRIRRNDCFIYLVCLLLLNGFVYITFFAGLFKVIMFHYVDLVKFPYESLSNISENMLLTYSIVFIMLMISTLIIIYKPFCELGIITRKELLRNTRLMNQNLKMILHTYKNAFLGVSRLTDLTNEYLLSGEPGKALSCTEQVAQIAGQNLAAISHNIDMLKKVNLHYAPINVFRCIGEALKDSCLSESIAVTKSYGEQSLGEGKPVRRSEAGRNGESAEETPAPLEILGDFDRMKEVFVNLFTNAEYALKKTEAPEIKITVICEADICSIDVRDNGCGIERQQIRNIFKAFYSTKTNQNSFGIGLNYAETVIKQHHGSITAKSEVNKYTSFQVVLPVYQKENSSGKIFRAAGKELTL